MTTYTCPMHPEIESDKPGDCPRCGMELEPIIPTSHEEMHATLYDIQRRFWISLLFTLLLMIVPNAPTQAIFATLVVLWAAFPLLKKGLSGLNMFTLILLGVGTAYIYSLVELVRGQHELYFDTAAMICTLVLLGQLLEQKARHKTTSAIRLLLDLAPKVATLESGEIIPLEQVQQGDRLRIKPGDKVPVDGTIIQGSGHIDEAMITGESWPIQKREGDRVLAGTINSTTNLSTTSLATGSFVMRADKVGENTVLAEIIKLVARAQMSKAPIQSLADSVASYFVPAVLVMAIITFFIWWHFAPLSMAMSCAVSVLIIACPCALGLATPMSLTVGIGKGALMGVLIKDGQSLQRLSEIDTLVVDKTGTLTQGKIAVDKAVAADPTETERLIQFGASLEALSEHPLAKAIVEYAKAKDIPLLPVDNFQSLPGKGVRGNVAGKEVLIGSERLLKEQNIPTPENQNLLVAIDRAVIGYFTVSDSINPTALDAIQKLKKAHITPIMLTGDKERTAKQIAKELGIDQVHANLLPEDKIGIIKALQKSHHTVAMAGDGINDAPAITAADVGIAMMRGSDIAIESADITLMKNDLGGVVKAYYLSLATMQNIKENLFFAFIYNILGIPIAAGVLYPSFGILLSPVLAGVAMTLSSLCVALNALRLKRTHGP